METSLKTGFAQIFSCCPKNLSRPKFGGAAAPLAPPGPYAYECSLKAFCTIIYNHPVNTTKFPWPEGGRSNGVPLYILGNSKNDLEQTF